MFRILCISVCVITVDCSLSNIPVVFSSPGDNVSLSCSCPKNQGCYEQLLQWLQIRPNGSMEMVDIGDQNKQSRFNRKMHNSSTFFLNILNAQPEDSGRYYCAEHSASYLSFYDKGVVLYVGDVWTNRSQVMILTQWWDEQTGNLTMNETEGPAELICVVTGLNSPWIPVTWKSSSDRRMNHTDQTWSTKLNQGEYCVVSRLRKELVDQDMEEVEEWWCEVQTGKNQSHRSSNSSFHWQREEEGWSRIVLYIVIMVCILCVCLLSILCYYRCHRLRGSPPRAAGVSALPESQEDVTSGVTYAHLDFKGPKEKRNNKERQTDNHMDRMVYSEVRYNFDS